MRIKIFFTIFLFILGFNIAFAHIDVVQPAKNQITVNSSTVYFIGNTTENADFSINSEPVKLWNNNFFVHVVPLQYGKNKIKLKSVKNGQAEEKIYIVNRKKTSSGHYTESKFIPKKENEVLYTKTIRPDATVRSKPSTHSQRLVDLPENVVLYLSGKKGDFYKIDETGSSEFWIHKSNIEEPVSLSKKIKPRLLKQKHYSDNMYDYQQFYVSHPVLYTIKQEDNRIKLVLYGVESKNEEGNSVPNYEYYFEIENPILGYDCTYEENKLIFKKARLPENIDINNPLKGLKIFIDAGHGGSDKGALGPTRINEKDINLSIANYLIEILKQSGADVVYSRIKDTQVGLKDRVKITKNNDVLISISIHNNSLPLSANPYVHHGTEVHYYNENAKLLAEIIKNNLVNDLNLKDNGVRKSSFALTRSTNPVSVLVEVAYMLNPDEYIKLQQDSFQKNVAISVKKSLEQYMYMLLK